MLSDHWNDVLKSISEYQRDIYFYEEYSQSHAFENRKPLAYIFKKSNSVYVLPMLVGSIPNHSDLYDFETPYGYGGPITNDTSSEFLSLAEGELAEECKANRIIAGFIRFHPLLNNASYMKHVISVIPDRRTVAIDLSEDPDQIWQSQIHSKNRNVIRKAKNCGLKFYIDEHFEFLHEFEKLYTLTMQKVNAERFYFFSDAYFKTLFHELKDKIFIGIVRKEEEAVAAAIYFHDGIRGHYHLAGSQYEWAKMGANNFLLYETALYLKNKGAEIFHLGGGTDQSETNSLLAFKSKFTTKFYQFYIGKGIFLRPEYEELCQEWESVNHEKKEIYAKMLLKYRY